MNRVTHRLNLLLAGMAIVIGPTVVSPRMALATDPFPLHNPQQALDVDDNHLLQPRDVLLVINQLQRQSSGGGGGVVPQSVDLNSVYYWDTSNDNHVTPLDALLVINGLLTMPAPEPSTFVLSGAGLVALAGYVWRRRRSKSILSTRA